LSVSWRTRSLRARSRSFSWYSFWAATSATCSYNGVMRRGKGAWNGLFAHWGG
jgi:hypothetical protein